VFLECPAPASISAERVEEFVSQRTREILADAEVHESGLREAALARREAEAAVERVKRARRRLAVDPDLSDAEVEEELAALRLDRDRKRARADELQAESAMIEAVNAARDWDRLSTSARRALIRLAIDRAEVERGRNAVEHRVTIRPRLGGGDALGKQAASLTA
jgi:hypothetical protein